MLIYLVYNKTWYADLLSVQQDMVCADLLSVQDMVCADLLSVQDMVCADLLSVQYGQHGYSQQRQQDMACADMCI